MTAPRLVWPTRAHHVTCGFFCYPFHYADDIGAVFEECVACASGVVITADTNLTFCEREGLYVEVLHQSGWMSRYFHLSRIDVRVGQFVTAGQHIGVTGSSGWFIRNGVCTPYGPHLHWALHAPTYAEAATVWAYPGAIPGGRWAVSPVWVITHQVEEEEMVYLIRPKRDPSIIFGLDLASGRKHPLALGELQIIDGALPGTKRKEREDVTLEDAVFDAIPDE